MDEWVLVAVKREFVPDWLYRIICFRLPVFGQLSLIFPFQQILHRKVDSTDYIEI